MHQHIYVTNNDIIGSFEAHNPPQAEGWQRNGGGAVTEGEKDNFPAFKDHRQCPLVLLIKAGWKEGKALGIGEKRAMTIWLFQVLNTIQTSHEQPWIANVTGAPSWRVLRLAGREFWRGWVCVASSISRPTCLFSFVLFENCAASWRSCDVTVTYLGVRRITETSHRVCIVVMNKWNTKLMQIIFENSAPASNTTCLHYEGHKYIPWEKCRVSEC